MYAITRLSDDKERWRTVGERKHPYPEQVLTHLLLGSAWCNRTGETPCHPCGGCQTPSAPCALPSLLCAQPTLFTHCCSVLPGSHPSGGEHSLDPQKPPSSHLCLLQLQCSLSAYGEAEQGDIWGKKTKHLATRCREPLQSHCLKNWAPREVQR